MLLPNLQVWPSHRVLLRLVRARPNGANIATQLANRQVAGLPAGV